MKGIIFTEFLEMVESSMGYEMVDQLITECNLPSGGVYTSVGTYPHKELVTMVSLLSVKTDTPVPELLKSFGKYLFSTFLRAYPSFFERCDHVFDFLESIDNYIHVEVQKLYQDAELPTFVTERIGNNRMVMRYKSERNMSDLAEGLIEESINYFKQNFEMNINRDPELNGVVIFSILLK